MQTVGPSGIVPYSYPKGAFFSDLGKETDCPDSFFVLIFSGTPDIRGILVGSRSIPSTSIPSHYSPP
jgi:hypothetical protein